MRASGSLAIIWKANKNHTQGHSSSLATWSETQRQLVGPRGDKPSPARPSPLAPAFMYESTSRSCAERQRQSARGSRQAGVREKKKKSAVAMETAAREELGLCAGWGREGRVVSAWRQPCGLCTCTTLCTRSRRKHEDRKCRTSGAPKKKNNKKKPQAQCT